MSLFARAAAAAFALALATPVLADGLTFEPAEPEGLDETALAAVQDVLWVNLPGQMVTFEQAGFAAFGAVLVPVGVELGPETLSAVQGLADREAAKEAGLAACAAQFATGCTVIGYLVPAE